MTTETIKQGSKGDAVKVWQKFLVQKGYKIGKPDGVFGPKTTAATRTIQKRNRLRPDGVVGKDTWSLIPSIVPTIIQTPSIPVSTPSSSNKNSWPKQNYVSMVNFYGPVGENQTQVVLPIKLCLAWEPKTQVSKISCNEKCASSVYTIFEKALKTYGEKDFRRLRLDYFGGCLNVRKMRGGSNWSIHSWGAAIDLDPDNNQLRWGKDRATFAKKEYEDFWKIVEGEGWVSLGRSRNFDWMHFQAAIL